MGAMAILVNPRFRCAKGHVANDERTQANPWIAANAADNPLQTSAE